MEAIVKDKNIFNKGRAFLPEETKVTADFYRKDFKKFVKELDQDTINNILAKSVLESFLIMKYHESGGM